MVFLSLFVLSAAAEVPCVEIRLASDDYVVDRQGWKNGKVLNPAVNGETISGGAPNVAAIDRASGTRTYVQQSVFVDAGYGLSCVEFGDLRAFTWAYAPLGVTPYLMVSVNGEIRFDAHDRNYWNMDLTQFQLSGLKRGDTIDLYVVSEADTGRCASVPAMGSTLVTCTRSVYTWEHRRYVAGGE